MKQQLKNIAIAGLVLLLCLNYCNQKENYSELEGLYISANDSLRISTDQQGRQMATIKVLSSTDKSNLLTIYTQDSTIKWLKNVVRDYKGRLERALVFSNETFSEGNTKTIIEAADTVFTEFGIEIYPRYKTSWESEWETGKIEATKDSIYRVIKMRNEFEITTGKASNGWFKKREYEVTVKNNNPNTYTTELREFSLKAKPKRFSLGLQCGAGLNLATMEPVFYGGAGVSFSLIGIK